MQEEDEANKRQAKNAVVRELIQLLKTCEIPQGAFSEFEDQVVFYFMLDSLNSRHYPLFGITDASMRFLPDDTKYKICKSLTSDQKAVIRWDFLVRYLTKGTDSSAGTTLLISLAKLHFPQELEDISGKYTNSYNIKYQKLKKQMEALKTKKKAVV